uniref:Alpha-1,6-mannosyl-glycoprotein 2-beta-N-acetylglucosaminyltransferase n=1 Tax=Hydatigena taeniaeformis TaxID=6205 RepID=A0A0R3X3D7_HYDTA
LIFPTKAPIAVSLYNSSGSAWTSTDAKIAENLRLIRNHIRGINEDQYIRNVDIFGEDSPLFIIIVQVHQRYTHLLYLIESLRRVHGIEEALVVFSHDFFSAEINHVINSIRFVRFTQIFFPYSRQIFPDSFPGPDPRDCHTRGYAADICFNALCFVITKMNVSKTFNGQYILLEEDYMVLKDLLHVLKLTKKLNKTYDIVVLGSYENSQTYNSPELVAMAGQCTTFYLKNFCIYDDYNWDWSLYFIDRVCANEKFRVLHFKNCGRVFHTGSCGLHANGSECGNVEASVTRIMDRIARGGGSDGVLFPSALLVAVDSVQRPLVLPNGGWGDARDRALCLAIVNNRWFPLAHLLSDNIGRRRLDVFEPLIPGVSNTTSSVL